MKTRLKIYGAAILLTLAVSSTIGRDTASAQVYGNVTYQDFYNDLSPYGRWIDYPEYGYVWCPDLGVDFRPYSTGGHWVWSEDFGWLWVSDYSWGWAPFHYGRWFYDPVYGWMWMPGYEWSPAWVAWRGGDGYYGWAPLRPGINISIGFSLGGYAPPANYWCFTPYRYITSPRLYEYCESPRSNVTIINNTTIINNYNYSRNVYVTGPRRSEVEAFTHERIRPAQVREFSSPAQREYSNNRVNIFRPNVERGNNRTEAPRQFVRYDNNQRSNNVAAFGRNFNDNGADRTNSFSNNRNSRMNPGTVNRGRDINKGNFDQRGGNNRIDWSNRRNENSSVNNGNNSGSIQRGTPNIFNHNENRQPNQVPQRDMNPWNGRNENINRQPDRNNFPGRNERSIYNQQNENHSSNSNPSMRQRSFDPPVRQAPVQQNERNFQQMPPQRESRPENSWGGGGRQRQFEQRGGGQSQPRQFEQRGGGWNGGGQQRQFEQRGGQPQQRQFEQGGGGNWNRGNEGGGRGHDKKG
jgi:hypothetical protein